MACQLFKKCSVATHCFGRDSVSDRWSFTEVQSKYHSQIVQELHHLGNRACNPAILHSGYNTEDREFIGGCRRTPDHQICHRHFRAP